jgi:hypothetical protein
MPVQQSRPPLPHLRKRRQQRSIDSWMTINSGKSGRESNLAWKARDRTYVNSPLDNDVDDKDQNYDELIML